MKGITDRDFEDFLGRLGQHVEGHLVDVPGPEHSRMPYGIRMSFQVEDPNWNDVLTDERREALGLYLQPGFTDLFNRSLFNLDSIDSKNQLAMVLTRMNVYKHLDEAIGLSHTNAPSIVMRGIPGSPFGMDIDDRLVGRTVCFNSYLPTTLDPRVVDLYDFDVRLDIMVPRGTGFGICTRPLFQGSNVEELLLKRASLMKVLCVTEDDYGHDVVLLGMFG